MEKEFLSIGKYLLGKEECEICAEAFMADICVPMSDVVMGNPRAALNVLSVLINGGENEFDKVAKPGREKLVEMGFDSNINVYDVENMIAERDGFHMMLSCWPSIKLFEDALFGLDGMVGYTMSFELNRFVRENNDRERLVNCPELRQPVHAARLIKDEDGVYDFEYAHGPATLKCFEEDGKSKDGWMPCYDMAQVKRIMLRFVSSCPETRVKDNGDGFCFQSRVFLPYNNEERMDWGLDYPVEAVPFAYVMAGMLHSFRQMDMGKAVAKASGIDINDGEAMMNLLKGMFFSGKGEA